MPRSTKNFDTCKRSCRELRGILTLFQTFQKLSLTMISFLVKRVNNRLGGMQDLAYFEGGIRDAS